MYLRKQLKAEAPDLYESLERSWDIAKEQWLPMIPISLGSFNSAPHFRNVENHLDRLLRGMLDRNISTVKLSTLDIYLLLAGVLFHDYGRVYGDKNHAAASAKEIPRQYQALGIPSHTIAMSLSRIAHYHDAEDPATAKIRLRETYVEPYGRADEKCVATLLALADHMDASVNRAIPRYVTSDSDIDIKGAFRRLISGTYYDPATCTIKTTLGGFDQEEVAPVNVNDYKSFRQVTIEEVEGTKRIESEVIDLDEIEYPKGEGGEGRRTPALFSTLCHLAFLDGNPEGEPKAEEYRCEVSPYFHEFLKLKKNESELRRLKSAGKVEAVKAYYLERAKKRKREPWPLEFLLAIVMCDLSANQRFLEEIQSDLYEIGLPIDNWFLEFNSEVYDSNGKQTNEKMIGDRFLKRVAMKMWDLRSQILDTSLMSYERLADSLHEQDAALIALAVKRIRKRLEASTRSAPMSIVATTWGWRFFVIDKGKTNEYDRDKFAEHLKP